MIKINYPENKEEKTKFEEDYLSIFNIDKIEEEWKKELEKVSCSVDELLIFPFDKLLEIYPKNKEESNTKEKDEKKKDKKTIYDFYQPKIANFFMQYSKELNLKTCYFCNIDFINTINLDVLDILQYGTKQELKELNGIDKNAKKIFDYREKESINCIEDIEKIDGIGKKTIEKVKKSKKNHFTLDHFLPKGKCPILSLSLYNFVPSCYSCNSKFKREKELLELFLSPTSKDFSVGTDVKFKVYYKDEVKKSDLTLKIEYPKNIQSYISTFKLKGRYEFHKNEAFELIEKQEKYSKTRIDEIAKILEISPPQVKKDIFGEELFDGDMQDKSFTKMKRDVARNIGIRGVKECLAKNQHSKP